MTSDSAPERRHRLADWMFELRLALRRRHTHDYQPVHAWYCPPPASFAAAVGVNTSPRFGHTVVVYHCWCQGPDQHHAKVLPGRHALSDIIRSDLQPLVTTAEPLVTTADEPVDSRGPDPLPHRTAPADHVPGTWHTGPSQVLDEHPISECSPSYCGRFRDMLYAGHQSAAGRLEMNAAGHPTGNPAFPRSASGGGVDADTHPGAIRTGPHVRFAYSADAITRAAQHLDPKADPEAILRHAPLAEGDVFSKSDLAALRVLLDTACSVVTGWPQMPDCQWGAPF